MNAVLNTPPPNRPTAAYIHVPFCRHRCGYCNFTLIAGRDDLIEKYLDALAIELAMFGKPRQIETLFFGGGTPTHLSPQQLRRLLECVRRWFPLAARAECSIEANPLDVNEERLEVLRAHGVNRISLGAQSFHEEKLRRLERDHSAGDIRSAFCLGRDFGMQVSVDLIFGAPGETLDDWRRDLDAALELRPDHLSLYGLTYERGTAFWSRLRKGELAQLGEEAERAMFLEAIDRATAAGLEHYEISNFALPGRRCRHNETYWAARQYFAAGPGAARYIDGVRESNHRSTLTWLERLASGRSPAAERERLGPEDRAREALVLGLRRTADGVERRAFAAEFGYEIDEIVGDEVRKLIAGGLLSDDGRRLRLTREGIPLADYIWSKFLRC